MKYLTDIEIAQQTPMDNITDVASRAGIDLKTVEQYGNYKAKLDYSLINDETVKNGKLILVTAITPTPAGEGKTTTTIGLADALKRPIGYLFMVLPGRGSMDWAAMCGWN